MGPISYLIFIKWMAEIYYTIQFISSFYVGMCIVYPFINIGWLILIHVSQVKKYFMGLRWSWLTGGDYHDDNMVTTQTMHGHMSTATMTWLWRRVRQIDDNDDDDTTISWLTIFWLPACNSLSILMSHYYTETNVLLIYYVSCIICKLLTLIR